MLFITFLLLSHLAAGWTFDCGVNFVCDPSVESDIYLQMAHMLDEAQCEQFCQVGHPNNPCKYFTWVPDTAPNVPNCFQMTECVEMTNPRHGEKSGAWSCEDESIFCGAISEPPLPSEKEALWICDHGVHPYGGPGTVVFQDVVCRSSCPSFQYNNERSLKSDIVVSSSCKYNRFSKKSEWSAAFPGNVLDGHGILIESASANPVPSCGCQDLVLKGSIVEEVGKVFSCNNQLTVNQEGDTVIPDNTQCVFQCSGTHMFDLYCLMGFWSEYGLESAGQISCYEQTTTTTIDPTAPTAPTDSPTDPTNIATLSTFWPTAAH